MGGAAALPAAVAALAVSTVLSAAVADLVRTEIAIARWRLATAAALTETDACLAAAVWSLPPGWDFAAALAGPDGVDGTADDGMLATRPSCSANARSAPGSTEPPRLLLRVEGRRLAGRRLLEAVVGRAPAPGVPALLWLGASPAPGTVSGSLVLDGTDPEDAEAPPLAALAAPAEAEALDAWVAAEAGVTAAPGTGPPLAAHPPPLGALAERARAAGAVGPAALAMDGLPPFSLALVDGDIVVAGLRRGAGLLFVDGTLDISGALDFAGLVVASRGVRIRPGGTLQVHGALWLGDADPALMVEGTMRLRQSRAALEAADRLLRLPRTTVVLGQQDLGQGS
jgi:hypothetical protein